MGKKSRRSNRNKGRAKSNKKKASTVNGTAAEDISQSTENVEDVLSIGEETENSADNAVASSTKTNGDAEAVVTEADEAIIEAEAEDKEEEGDIPAGLSASLSLLTDSHQKLALALCEAGQSHLFTHWPKPSGLDTPSSNVVTKIKVRFMEQLERMDAGYAR